MEELHKSNWQGKKKALFLLPILLGFAFINIPKQTSKAEQLTTVPSLPNVPISNQLVGSTTVNLEASSSSSVVVSKPVTAKLTTEYGLKIDAINLNISLGQTTLDSHQALLVPANPNHAAWYVNGPRPGENGTTLITGHLDSAAGAGIFYNLKKLKAGDTIEIEKDGQIATYTIDKLKSYAQDSTFPWNEVYSTTGPSSLRIITCDGVYSRKTGHYSRNLVVYASLVSNFQ
jgi:LPXTG-site transpeptidase (sortase) family protein